MNSRNLFILSIIALGFSSIANAQPVNPQPSPVNPPMANIIPQLKESDKVSCPPPSALSHAAPGQPWVLKKPYADQWAVIQGPMVESKVTSLANRNGALATFLQDHYDQTTKLAANHLTATCFYDAADEEINEGIYLISTYTYNPLQNPKEQGFEPVKNLHSWVCRQLIVNGEVTKPDQCGWVRKVFK